MSKKEECCTGCMIFTGGEIRHINECVFYPESLTEKYDNLEKELETTKKNASSLEIENLNLRIILQKLQKDLNRDEHVDEFWMKDLFPEAVELETTKKLLEESLCIVRIILELDIMGNDNQGKMVMVCREFLNKLKNEKEAK